MIPHPPLLVITDRRSAARDVREVAAAALEAGCRWIMVREKDLETEALAALARDVAALARPYGATILVNGDTQAARVASAAGVHLPQRQPVASSRALLGEAALIGMSAHSRAEARAAAADGADYVTLSPIFATESKPGYGPALGLETLAGMCRSVALPVIALAGIGPDNAAACLDAGAAGVAVMGAVMRADDPRQRVSDLLAAIGGAATAVG